MEVRLLERVRDGPPPLPLDRAVPSSALQRRGAISFSSSSSYRTAPRFERRGGISFPRTDQNARYVRMLGDVKIRTKPDLTGVHRRGSLHDSELKILESLDLGPRRSQCGLKFLSLHKTRRRQRPSLRVSQENASILDDHYGGQAKCLLSTVGEWEFNIFNLDKLTNGRALFNISLHLFQEHNLIETFQLDMVKLMKCFTLIEEGYHSNNPYHNAVHAADVTQAMHCYLKENKLAQCLTPLEIMIALLSAIIHDLDHPGVNQSFLIATSNHLAALYKNSSVLENHHWRSGMAVFHECGLFEHLDLEIWEKIVWQLKSLILATDITRQQEFLTKLKRNNDQGDLDLHIEGNRHFMLQIALKCADICNPCRPWEQSKRWSEQVCDEFFQQGDFERKLNLPVTPTCDRYKTTVAKIQLGFMQFVAMPLFQEWQRFNPTLLSRNMLRYILENKSSWDTIIHRTSSQQQVTVEREEPVSRGSTPEICVGCVNDDSGSIAESDTKENISVSESSPVDVVIETRFELVPLTEDIELSGCLPRRHSLPPLSFPKDLMALLPRRESSPSIQDTRRHSLPKNALLQSTSMDRIGDKLSSISGLSPNNGNRTLRLENLLAQSGLSHLSSVLETGTQSPTDSAATHSRRSSTGRANVSSIRFPPLTRPSARDPLYSAVTNVDTVTYATTSRTFHTKSPNGAPKPNNSRQVLKPLNTNSRLPSLSRSAPARGRSVSEDVTTLRAHARGLRMLLERPRSLSFDTEAQPLLPSHVRQRWSFSGESGRTYADSEENSHPYTSTASYQEVSEAVPMATSPVLEEESSLMTPLLHEHRILTEEDLQGPNTSQ